MSGRRCVLNSVTVVLTLSADKPWDLGVVVLVDVDVVDVDVVDVDVELVDVDVVEVEVVDVEVVEVTVVVVLVVVVVWAGTRAIPVGFTRPERMMSFVLAPLRSDC